MKTYDLYSEVEMGTFSITFGIMHGDGRWTHWHDTGWEFEITKDCVIEFVEAIDDNGDSFIPSQTVLDEAVEIADRVYWENETSRGIF